MEKKALLSIDNSTFPPTLQTKRLLLRPLMPSDALDVFEYASQPENTKYMSWDTHKTMEDTLSHIELLRLLYDSKASYDYAITLLENKKVIGTGGAFKVSALPHRAEIGYILNKEFWGKGYCTEAMRAVIEYLFCELGVHRVEAMHFEENTRSGEVMKRLGMSYEGLSVDNMFVRGKYVSCHRYAVINTENTNNCE